jgi:hypothetical protein
MCHRNECWWLGEPLCTEVKGQTGEGWVGVTCMYCRLLEVLLQRTIEHATEVWPMRRGTFCMYIMCPRTHARTRTHIHTHTDWPWGQRRLRTVAVLAPLIALEQCSQFGHPSNLTRHYVTSLVLPLNPLPLVQTFPLEACSDRPPVFVHLIRGTKVHTDDKQQVESQYFNLWVGK